jgi:integrase
MTMLDSTVSSLRRPYSNFELDEAQLAAAGFLARYGGRTLEAYRHDLRSFFQWAADVGIAVLEATRPHIELYRSMLEERGLAASTIDRRLSTVCGFYCFAHIDGRIASNPAHYVRRPPVHASDARGLDRSELGVFLFTAEQYDHAHSALAVLLDLNRLRVSEACATDIEDLGIERGHRTLQIVGKGNKPAVIPLVPRTARTVDLAIGERREGPILRRRSSLPATPTREPPRSTTVAARTSTGTPPMSSSRSSPVDERSRLKRHLWDASCDNNRALCDAWSATCSRSWIRNPSRRSRSADTFSYRRRQPSITAIELPSG